ncbi:hypothetical protein ACTXT7_015400 [Hymenolepis weldensis]
MDQNCQFEPEELKTIEAQKILCQAFLSLSAATTFLRAFNLLIGLPHVHHDDIDRRLLEERLEFSVGDLTVKVRSSSILTSFNFNAFIHESTTVF